MSPIRFSWLNIWLVSFCSTFKTFLGFWEPQNDAETENTTEYSDFDSFSLSPTCSAWEWGYLGVVETRFCKLYQIKIRLQTCWNGVKGFKLAFGLVSVTQLLTWFWNVHIIQSGTLHLPRCTFNIHLKRPGSWEWHVSNVHSDSVDTDICIDTE